MLKILLVEDDKSLREIYGVRLLAEGYDIVSCGDGEEALAMAIKERPRLIISDVMMPKVSGFDMLDILRSTTETKDIKVIMMTALSSDEQRTRGEGLGADRYLVKSQVGIEDVVRVVHEVLGDTGGGNAAPVPTPSARPFGAPAPTPNIPGVPTQAPPMAFGQRPSAPQQSQPVPPRPVTPMPTPNAGSFEQAVPQPQSPYNQPQQNQFGNVPKPPSLKNRVIQPINDPTQAPVNMNELLDRELAQQAGITEESRPEVASTEQAREMLDQQLAAFEPQLTELSTEEEQPAEQPQTEPQQQQNFGQPAPPAPQQTPPPQMPPTFSA
ncbi:hypothetical protein B7Z17_02460 [Candidatus Saccharibacteria bacterium 32-49-10]|nr:MAG: hypothetical protein B7Z17_02460 [Candidatus Saccharibacteria bacterium 32-49-10]